MDLIAVHAGAGYQSDAKRDSYMKLCSSACEAGIRALRNGHDLLDAVVQAAMVLENSELTNAGRGSNVCMDGSIECDASVMTSSNHEWAAVGALSDIKNPIAVAQELLKSQRTTLPCGLVPPCVLVGDGAKKWALENGVSSLSELTTERSLRVHSQYKRRFEEADQLSKQKEIRLDTIGVVGISRTGRTVSAISSGGIALKSKGRLGQACMYGAGCWATDSVAVTTSGVGEYLIKTLLAKELANDLTSSLENDRFPVDVIKSSFQRHFAESIYLRNVMNDDKIAGALAVIKDPQLSNVEILSVHNSPTMCIAFMSTSQTSAKTIFSKSSASLGQDLITTVTATCVSLND